MNSLPNLKNKKILLFAPQGKGIYGSAIYDALVKKGATVHIYNERVSTSTVSKIIYRKKKELLRFQFSSYINKIIKENEEVDFNYVLIIRGEAFSSKELTQLRIAIPNAKYILYLWDSLKNNNVQSVFPYFDKVFSFDLKDCAEVKGLKFRPLFFTDHYRKIALLQEVSLDVIFIGTIHSDRLSFIKKAEEYLKEHGLQTYFYLYFPSRVLFIRKKLTDPSFKKMSISDFNFKMIPAYEVASLIAKSRASLDIQGPSQSGLTMRTIEVLGAKRKLITTNQTIKEYDFYNENNILVVDRNNPIIDPSFIKCPFVEIEKDIYDRYSLESWLDEIFSLS